MDAVFLTHGHVDHILAMNEYRATLPGEWKAYLGEPDLHLWYRYQNECYHRQCVNQQISDFGLCVRIPPIADPDVLLKGGEVFTFGDTTVECVPPPLLTVRCILSPGHSQGSVVYYVERKGDESLLVTGDVLFSNSMGRTEFLLSPRLTPSWTGIPILEGTSSYSALVKSIRALGVRASYPLHE